MGQHISTPTNTLNPRVGVELKSFEEIDLSYLSTYKIKNPKNPIFD